LVPGIRICDLCQHFCMAQLCGAYRNNFTHKI
jgi:hypothetical protein